MLDADPAWQFLLRLDFNSGSSLLSAAPKVPPVLPVNSSLWSIRGSKFIGAIAYRATQLEVQDWFVIHLSSQPRKLRIAKCGRVIDGKEHTQTMLPGQVDCPDCRSLFHAGRVWGGYSQRKSKIP